MGKKTYIVAHPNLHLRVSNGDKSRMEHVKRGTEYTCEELDDKNHLIAGKKLVLAKQPKKASAPSKG